MFGIFFVFFSSITLLNAQLCPDQNSPPKAAVDCVLVPGCNFDNGSLTPLATQCSNQLSDGDCQLLFPCPTTALTTPVAIPACDPKAAGSATPNNPATLPYVRAPACLSSDAREVALQCAKQCGLCCEAPEYNCADDDSSPINCELNKNKCRDPNWTNIMSQYCPKTCGLCNSGTCTDLNAGCHTMTGLCRHVDWISYMVTQCARTCDFCSTTPGSTCSDIATNCAPNVNLCTNTVYRELMQQQCCATCSGASGSSSGSCSDSDSNCSNWVRNGFCSNSFYTTAQKRQYCARSCNLC